MKAQWNALPLYLTSTIMEILKFSPRNMNEQEISNTISGLGRLGLHWEKSIPAEVQRTILDAFLRTSGDLHIKGLAMTIHGLGRMNANISTIPVSCRNQLLSSVSKMCDSLNPQETSNIIYGLGKMGVVYSSKNPVSNDVISSESAVGVPNTHVILSKNARKGLEDALVRELVWMNAQGVSNSLWGLMLMQAEWSKLSVQTRSLILQVFSREARRMSEQEIVNSVYALGKLGVSALSDMSEASRLQLFVALTLQAPSMSSPGIVMTLLGLGRLQLRWTELPHRVKSTLSETCARVLRLVENDSVVSSILHGLASVDAKWVRFPLCNFTFRFTISNMRPL